MADIIVGVILIVVVGSACYYIWKEKKKGRKCIGCPSSGSCPKCGSKKA
ncbi:MAG: FeoB-associated Cys-rich membrane protein [Eubacteriales bacterium]|nr:FeoB-associated Cys-rich membrane protein [Eubacteriales bacterium]